MTAFDPKGRNPEKSAFEFLVALAYGLPDGREFDVSEEEIPDAERGEAELPPEYRSALDSLDPNLIQRIREGGVQRKLPDSADPSITLKCETPPAQVYTAVTRAFNKVMRFPSIPGLSTMHIEGHLAAGVPEASAVELDRYSIEGTNVNLRLMTDPAGRNVEVRVFTREGSPSLDLDGARFTWKDGMSVVVHQGQALILRPSLSAEFAFTTADGTLFDLTPLP